MGFEEAVISGLATAAGVAVGYFIIFLLIK